MRLVKRIEQAIARGELFVEYQPIVGSDGRLVGHEALVRWQHPQRGVLPPAVFIPMIEDRPVMEVLTSWVIDAVLGQAAHWRAQGRCPNVSLNLSASLLVVPTVVSGLARQLDDRDMEPDTVTVEVTESFLVGNTRQAAQMLNQLGELGVRRSIDDFGTGYTSLKMLQTYVVDELKIDRSFTVNVLTSPADRAIVAGLVELAHRLDLVVVGEGVENEAVAAALIGIGCDRLQGYFYGRPDAPAGAAVPVRRSMTPPVIEA